MLIRSDQVEKWVLGLLERAEKVSAMLDEPSVPAGEVAELTGYAKSSLVLLTREQANEYHRRKDVHANEQPKRKLAKDSI